MSVVKAIIKYHHDTVPAPKLIIGECAYIFPTEMMVRCDDEGTEIVQRKYGLTKTGKITAINIHDSTFETDSTVYMLVTEL